MSLSAIVIGLLVPARGGIPPRLLRHREQVYTHAGRMKGKGTPGRKDGKIHTGAVQPGSPS